MSPFFIRIKGIITYAIGIAKPVAVNIDTFGTGRIHDEAIKDIVLKFLISHLKQSELKLSMIQFVSKF